MIEQLLDRCVESLAGPFETEADRRYFDSLRAHLTRAELLDVVTRETVCRLRMQLAAPARLILTLN